MRRHPVILFLLVVSALVAAIISFIQSQQFAGLLKRVAATYIPGDAGVFIDFRELSVQFFPPALSILQPQIVVRERNVFNLPPNSRAKAERINLEFRPLQMLTGNIRIHEVGIVRGEVILKIDSRAIPASRPAQKAAFHWNDLLEIKANGFRLIDSMLDVDTGSGNVGGSMLAEDVRIHQINASGEPAYEIDAKVLNLHGRFPKEWGIPPRVEEIRAMGVLSAKSFEFTELSVKNRGTVLAAKGRVEGDVLNSRSLPVSASITLDGDLPKILGTLKGMQTLANQAKGKLSFRGDVQGNLEKPEETLVAKGKLAGQDVEFRAWSFDRVNAEAAWSASAGEVNVTHVELFGRERERVGGTQPGHGGRIEAGPFAIKIGSPEPIEVPVRLERAHIHWLGAPALKQIYALDLRASGPINLRFVPETRDEVWNAVAKMDLTIDEFQLDNQRLGQKKKLTRILKIPRFAMQGDLSVDKNGVYPEGVELSIARGDRAPSRFKVMGKIDFKEGYDLNAEGAINLADVGIIAENPIHGDGALKVSVHGPASRVFIDFDANIRDAKYLNLDLGALQGRITWDDDPSRLLFKNVRASQGALQYSVNGGLDLSDADTIDLDVAFERGSVRDINRVFGYFTEDLWWYPTNIQGDVSGTAKVSGGIALDRMKIAAILRGKTWSFFGERFLNVRLSGAYDKGAYILSSMEADKGSAGVSGRISLSADKKMDWEVQTYGMTLRDLDLIARLDVPMRGTLGAYSRGSGYFGAINSFTEFHLSDFSVRGVSSPGSELTIRSDNGVTDFKGQAMGGQAELDMSYNFTPGLPSALKLKVSRLDFTPMLLLLNPKNIQDRALLGVTSGSVDLKFKSGEIERGTGRVELGEYILSKAGSKFTLKAPVAFNMQDGDFSIPPIVVRGDRGDLAFELKSEKTKLTGSTNGKLDLSIVEFLTPTISRLSGVAELSSTLGGTLKEPKVIGAAKVIGASMLIPSVESQFENLNGSFSLKQNLIQVEKLESELGGGRISGSGQIELFGDRVPRLALQGNISGSRIKVFPFQFVKVRGRVGVTGAELPYLIDGKIVADSALSREKMLNQSGSRAMRSASYTPPAASRREGDLPKFRLKIDVNAPGGILVQNELFNAELKSNVTLVGTLDAPRLVGTADVVQGKLVFKDREFQIQSANLNFDNPAVINPLFNMTASSDVNGNKVQIYASGRMDRYKIDLSSNPVMPESEIISLLALGVTTEDVRKMRTGDRSSFEQGEAASLLLHSLDFNRDVQDKTGFQIGLDEAVDRQAGTSAFRPRDDTESTAAPKIVLRRKVGQSWEFRVGSTVGVGTNSQKEVNAEYRVTPGFSVLGVWDTLEAADSLDSRTSYGVDIKLQKRFK